MSLAYSDQFIDRGSNFNIQLNLTDDNGVPLNLSTYSVRGQAKRSYYSNTISLVLNSVIDAANGIVQLSADQDSTYALQPGKLVYDVLLIELNTRTTIRLLEGQLIISPSTF